MRHVGLSYQQKKDWVVSAEKMCKCSCKAWGTFIYISFPGFLWKKRTYWKCCSRKSWKIHWVFYQTYSFSCEFVDNSNLFVAKWFLAYLITTGGCTRDAVQSVGGQDKQYKKLWINPFGTWSLYYYHDGSVILAHETGKTCLQVCSLQCVNNKCLQQFWENTSLISTRKERYTRLLGFATN